jgi:hypothetical protein
MSYCQSNEELQKHQQPTRHRMAPAQGGDQRATVTRHEDDARGLCLRGVLRRHDGRPARAGRSRDGPHGPSRALLQKLSRIALVS